MVLSIWSACVVCTCLRCSHFAGIDLIVERTCSFKKRVLLRLNLTRELYALFVPESQGERGAQRYPLIYHSYCANIHCFWHFRIAQDSHSDSIALHSLTTYSLSALTRITNHHSYIIYFCTFAQRICARSDFFLTITTDFHIRTTHHGA